MTIVQPVRISLSGRTLLLVAGVPGAGKSTLLNALPRSPRITVVDSETYRVALRRMFGRTPYAWYRPLVHLLQRLGIVWAALSAAPTVVVHLPATGRGTRTAVARLAARTGRAAHLLWLDVDPVQARRGQRARGRVVPESSFAAHVTRAAATGAELRAGAVPPGFAAVTVLDRAAAAGGLSVDNSVDTGAPPPLPSPRRSGPGGPGRTPGDGPRRPGPESGGRRVVGRMPPVDVPQ